MEELITVFGKYWYFILGGILVFVGPQAALLAVKKALWSKYKQASTHTPGKLTITQTDTESARVQLYKETAYETARTQGLGQVFAHTERGARPLSKAEKRERKEAKAKRNKNKQQ